MVERAPAQWPTLLLTTVILVAVVDNTDCLTAAENLFLGLSNMCRTVMKIHTGDRQLLKEVDKLSILWHTPEGTVRTPLREAAAAISQSKAFDGRNMTVIVIHGFNDHPESFIPAAISEAYVKRRKYNVMMLDCSEITTGMYPRAAYMTQPIGRAFAHFLAELIKSSELVPENVHVIGISLGAQTAGWAGRFFRSTRAEMIHRITGLDPAGPCFTYAKSGEGLCQDDAEYVDVIHVNRGVQGILEATGHADYFVNGGGPMQPGCGGNGCSHHRAGILYIESLDTDGRIFGRKCSSWNDFMVEKCNRNEVSELGWNSSVKSRGVYYLKTSGKYPYSLGMKGATSKIRSIFDLLSFG